MGAGTAEVSECTVAFSWVFISELRRRLIDSVGGRERRAEPIRRHLPRLNRLAPPPFIPQSAVRFDGGRPDTTRSAATHLKPNFIYE